MLFLLNYILTFVYFSNYYRMKTQLEEIAPPKGSSFSVSLNPRMSDLFFWHFHPEFELVFFKGSSTRHVGNHLSKFSNNDLVLIGSYIPHLNFDYGIKTPYEKIVIHLKEDFLENAILSTPEFKGIYQLLVLAKHGITFSETTKNVLESRIFELVELEGMNQFLALLSILNELNEASDKELLHKEPFKNQHTYKDHIRLKTIYNFIDTNYQRKISIQEIGKQVHLTEAAFCRYFKKMTKLTFTRFVNHYRIEKAKKSLLQNNTVTETCFDCGFESLSYFNRTFKQVTGKSPQIFKKEFRNQLS